jgi:hypothetical protein
MSSLSAIRRETLVDADPDVAYPLLDARGEGMTVPRLPSG